MKITRMNNVWRVGILLMVLAFLGTGGDLIAQSRPAGSGFDTTYTALARPDATAKPANGSGIFVAGDFWESYMPQSQGPFYSENSSVTMKNFVRLGNFDRLWSHPTHIWPGGWNLTAFWAKNILMAEYNPDDTFNPAQVGGADNPNHDGTSGPNYSMAAFAPNPSAPGRMVAGYNDPARNYTIETKWVDATRHHAVYECAWPTSLGIDVKMKVHQWSLNWNSFDDFHIVEFQLTNTGNVDIDCDGTVERTNNAIRALVMYIGGEVAMSALVNTSGTRSSHWGAGRHSGYVGDNDPTGAPWAIHAVYPGEDPDGGGNFGMNSIPYRYYTDIWSTWTWLGAKQGTDPTGPDKQTLYGTHPVGEGAERGWYWTSGDAIGLSAGRTNPKSLHTAAMGTWYVDGGKSRDQAKFDLNPNPNFFASGTQGDPTTFVPLATPTGPPNGTRMRQSLDIGAAAFEKSVFEDDWTIGYTSQQNFDADSYSGIGPFGLAVGETATIYLAQGAGFRLMGAANAMSAARYIFGQGLQLPVDYPAVPQMSTGNTLNKTVKISWDNASAAHANFGGYKIYRADLARRINYLDEGIRVVDNYWRQMTPSPTVPDEFKRPVNPKFDPALSLGREGAPDAWGPYHLVKVIPAAELSQYADNADPAFQYAWEDPTIELGFKYWYYVAAYTSTGYDLGPTWVSYPGTNPATSPFIETSNINRNGATGTWQNTYPFAIRNPFYPTDLTGLSAMGAGFVVQSALANPGDLAAGTATIGVKPNPYKKKALFDSASDAADHKVIFYNLPPSATITILDVSGQIIDEIQFSSNDPNNGSIFWDLFAKNGAEVASGLYIYVVDYDGGQHVGYLSVLR